MAPIELLNKVSADRKFLASELCRLFAAKLLTVFFAGFPRAGLLLASRLRALCGLHNAPGMPLNLDKLLFFKIRNIFFLPSSQYSSRLQVVLLFQLSANKKTWTEHGGVHTHTCTFSSFAYSAVGMTADLGMWQCYCTIPHDWQYTENENKQETLQTSSLMTHF